MTTRTLVIGTLLILATFAAPLAMAASADVEERPQCVSNIPAVSQYVCCPVNAVLVGHPERVPECYL